MEHALEVAGLVKRYPGFVLEEVSFSVPRGYVMGLIGPNGAGKTTTLKSILGLLRPDAGTIRALGLDVSAHGAEARSRIGFVHDDPHFYDHLSLGRNAALVAAFYPTWDAAEFDRLVDAFGLSLRQRFDSLSRGTKTKFALALALAHRAELVLMDEPTSGLDPVFRRELLDTLTDLLQDERTSILFSTHITSDLERIADYITLIQHGRVVFSAAKDEILESWALVKGAPELPDRLPGDYFRGIHRGAHGFEALTDDAAAVRAELGEAVVIERASLDDVVLYTAADDDAEGRVDAPPCGEAAAVIGGDDA